MRIIRSITLTISILFIHAFSGVTEFTAQPLNDDGNLYTIIANGSNQGSGSAQDHTIPLSTAKNTLTFTLRGGDGGYAKAGANCKSNGGGGAITEVVFKVGDGTNDLKYGGTIRFIVGKYGENDEVGGSNHTTGSGGGGTAILYHPPGNNTWTILAAAGAGGGAHQGNILGGCVDSQKGQGGRSTENGGNGEGNNHGNGGTGGNGGTDGTDPIYNGFAGGGAYTSGTPNGGGAGFPNGGAGAAGLTTGGYGFGGGGAGTLSGGGGGGGYSGGGGGGDNDNGGGGGSYVNSTYALSSTITAGALGGGNSVNGYVNYTFSITTIAWTGSVNDNWNNTANWSPSRIPDQSDFVEIHSSSHPPRISSTTTAYARVVRVFSDGALTINLGGVLNLKPLLTNGIWNAGTIENTGDINITRYNSHNNFNGIENAGGTIINHLGGEIHISGTDSPGILNSSGGSFNNQFGGTIFIGTTGAQISDYGIRNNANCSFTNFGSLSIRHTDLEGIYNYGSFSNASNGQLSINQTNATGIICLGGLFTNSGLLKMGELANIGDNGIYLASNTNLSFKNNASGIINIWQADETGVYIEPGSTFQNTGQLVIGGLGGSGTGGSGIGISGTLLNKPEASISIDQAQLSGIVNFPTGKVDNEGLISIGGITASTLDGIQNQATFNNLTSGRIVIKKANGSGILNAIGMFTNEGNIQIGENGTIGMHAIQNGYPGYNPLFANIACSAAIHIYKKEIYDLGNTFSNSGVILQQSNVNSDIESNTGVIIYNAGTFSVNNGDSPIAVSGPIAGRKIWTACNGNGWNNSLNWYPSGAPVSTDEVVIYAMENDPLITAATTAQSKYVYVEADAGLTNNGNLTLTNGDFRIYAESTVNGNGQYFFNGNFDILGGSFSAGTSTVTMTGLSIKAIGSDPVSFYNLVVDKPEDKSLYILTDVTVTNNLTISSGDIDVYGFLSGALSCPHLYLGNGSDLNNHGSVTLTGNNNGALWIQSGASAQGNGLYEISGSLAIENGGSFVAGTSTVTMNGTGNSGISPAPISFYNLVIDKPADKKVTLLEVTVTNALTVESGDIEMLSGYSLTCPDLHLNNGSDLLNDGNLSLTSGDLWIEFGATVNGNGQYTIPGNLIQESGGEFSPGSSTVVMTGSGNHLIGSAPINFYHLIIDKPVTDKITLSNDVSVSHLLDLNAGQFEVPTGVSLTCPNLSIYSNSKVFNYGLITLTN